MLTILPRILAILYIAFISLFALDVFEGGYGVWGTMIALFMHLIPSFLLIACLILAWKRPKVSGVLFLMLGIVFTIFFRTYQHLDTFLLISLPLFVIGVRFIWGGMMKKKG
jgi:hypothetical protein